ncbi:anacyclamide/piricyclamide family prenylated cyclic peptide [Roseofilum reptotaenium]|uniref:anacyclamide/piricyclamide family prenylated cyclic peptide n=1 Tax=Roseofilum reptotaenium TaxID=1233427 RepID=UPI000AC74DF8
MKTKKLTPVTVAPVKRENVATVSRDGNAIAPLGPMGIGSTSRFGYDDWNRPYGRFA